jgi:hypothetical protein
MKRMLGWAGIAAGLGFVILVGADLLSLGNRVRVLESEVAASARAASLSTKEVALIRESLRATRAAVELKCGRAPQAPLGVDVAPRKERGNEELKSERHVEPGAPPDLSIRDQQSRLQTVFDEQPVDSSWAPAAQSDLLDGLRRRLPSQSSVEVAECRSTLCRAEIWHKDQADYTEFLMNMTKVWKGDLIASKSTEAGPDEWAMTVFLSKPGNPFPLLQDQDPNSARGLGH